LNPKNPNSAGVTKSIEDAARAVGGQVHFLHASNEQELDAAFAALGPDCEPEPFLSPPTHSSAVSAIMSFRSAG